MFDMNYGIKILMQGIHHLSVESAIACKTYQLTGHYFRVLTHNLTLILFTVFSLT